MDGTAAPGPERDPDPVGADRSRGQVEIIRRSLDAEVAVGFASAGPGDQGGVDRAGRDVADFDYLFRDQHLLVRDADLRGVLDRLPGAAVDDNLIRGVSRISLPGDGDVSTTLDELDRELGAGVVTPDHVLWVTPKITCCPATEPESPDATAPFPGVYHKPGAGRGVKVSVVDTGWHPPAGTDPSTPWLAGVTGDAEQGYDAAAIRPYEGHGTFIAGVVRCQAPAAEVTVEGFLPNGGAVFESEIIVQLTEALQHAPDIISLSAGGTTRKNRPLLSFEIFHDNFLSKAKNTVLVAAAGNDGVRTPFWPAASPWAIAVGAVDQAGHRASFSNFGSWVDVYALGVDLVNAYPRGTYTCVEPPHVGEARHFEGLCRWSGTSFSTPVVAGMIARRMSRTGLSARHAADQLLAEARAHSVPGVGPVL